MMHRGRTPISAPRLDLRLLQPKPHTHLAVHGGRRRGVFLRLLARARASAELAEAEVAVGDERAHAEAGGESESLPILVLGLSDQTRFAP